ncbi:MAG: cytochrome c biogenesis protein CcsA [Planctomycetaceae bacterium]
MGSLAKVHLFCFLLSYLVALICEIGRVLRRKLFFARGLAVLFGAAGLFAHTIYLINRSQRSGLPPLVGSSHDWMLVLAWLGAMLYLVLVVAQQRLAVGLFLLPTVIGLVVMAMLVEESPHQIHQLATYRWGMLHASSLVIGMASVAASTICALMFLLQFQKLKGRASWLHRLQLPSLERLTSLNRWFVVGAFAMLTLGLVTGVILGEIHRDTPGSEFRWTDPVVIGSFVVWGLMLVTLIWLLRAPEHTGRQVARQTAVAGAFLLLTIFGLMLLTGGVHGKSEAQSESTDSSAAKSPDADVPNSPAEGAAG